MKRVVIQTSVAAALVSGGLGVMLLPAPLMAEAGDANSEGWWISSPDSS